MTHSWLRICRVFAAANFHARHWTNNLLTRHQCKRQITFFFFSSSIEFSFDSSHIPISRTHKHASIIQWMLISWQLIVTLNLTFNSSFTLNMYELCYGDLHFTLRRKSTMWLCEHIYVPRTWASHRHADMHTHTYMYNHLAAVWNVLQREKDPPMRWAGG